MASSPQKLIDLQIEESLSKETLMSIDSGNKKEDFISLIFFLIILFLNFLIGIFGPPKELMTFSKVKLNPVPDGRPHICFHQIEISRSRFPIHFSLYVDFSGYPSTSPQTLNFKVKINKIFSNGTSTSSQFQSSNFLVEFAKGSPITNSFPIFINSLANFKILNTSIEIFGKLDNLDDTNFRYIYTEPYYFFFEICTRIFYIIADSLILFIFFSRLRRIKTWHLEQTLSYYLLYISLISNNPLFFIGFFTTSSIFQVISAMIDSFGPSFILFFVLIIFDNLRYKNKAFSSGLFYIPKLILMVIHYIFSVIHYTFENSCFNFSKEQKENIISKLNLPLNITRCIFFCWLLFVIITARISIDVTDHYKFGLYFLIIIFTFGIHFGINFLIDLIPFFKDSSLLLMSREAIMNLFSILMVYFHWPYEILEDQEAANLSDDVQDIDLYVNEDNESSMDV